MITKKADIYLVGNDKEVRTSLSFCSDIDIWTMMDSIATAIDIHCNNGETKLKSIYFSEEETSETAK